MWLACFRWLIRGRPRAHRLRFTGDGKLARRAAWLVLFRVSAPEFAYALAARRNPRPGGHARIVGKFGLTPLDYARMLATQGGLCAICRKPEVRMRDGLPMRLAVDHDHESGRVRGLLCARCNLLLGAYELVRDDARFLAYLAEIRSEAM